MDSSILQYIHSVVRDYSDNKNKVGTSLCQNGANMGLILSENSLIRIQQLDSVERKTTGIRASILITNHKQTSKTPYSPGVKVSDGMFDGAKKATEKAQKRRPWIDSAKASGRKLVFSMLGWTCEGKQNDRNLCQAMSHFGPLHDQIPLQTGGFPLPCLYKFQRV